MTDQEKIQMLREALETCISVGDEQLFNSPAVEKALAATATTQQEPERDNRTKNLLRPIIVGDFIELCVPDKDGAMMALRGSRPVAVPANWKEALRDYAVRQWHARAALSAQAK